MRNFNLQKTLEQTDKRSRTGDRLKQEKEMTVETFPQAEGLRELLKSGERKGEGCLGMPGIGKKESGIGTMN